METFNNFLFQVPKQLFYEVLENPDKGFGFEIKFNEALLTPLQLEIFNFLVKLYKKNLVGNITLRFKTERVGEIEELSRKVEEFKKKGKVFILSNSY